MRRQLPQSSQWHIALWPHLHFGDVSATPTRTWRSADHMLMVAPKSYFPGPGVGYNRAASYRAEFSTSLRFGTFGQQRREGLPGKPENPLALSCTPCVVVSGSAGDRGGSCGVFALIIDLTPRPGAAAGPPIPTAQPVERPYQEIAMSNRITVATAGLLAGAAMLAASLGGAAVSQAASSGVDIQGTYPKRGTYTGVAGGISLCTQHGIKMPCGPSFTPGITKANNEG